MKKLLFLFILITADKEVLSQSNSIDEAAMISKILNTSLSKEQVRTRALGDYKNKPSSDGSTTGPKDTFTSAKEIKSNPDVPILPKGGGGVDQKPGGAINQKTPGAVIQGKSKPGEKYRLPQQTAVIILSDTLNIPETVKNRINKEVDFLYILKEGDCIEINDFPKKFIYLNNIINGIESGVENASIGDGGYTNLQANIIYGITDFFITRAKEELVSVYVKRWYDTLNNDAIISPLLPHTLSVTNAFIEDNALSIAKYGDKWKAAFEEDFRNIPVQFQKDDYVNIILTHLKIKDAELQKQLLPVITGGDQLIYNLYLKKNLVNVLSDMSSHYLSDTDTELPAFKKCIILSNLVANLCGQFDKNNSVYVPLKISDIRNMDKDTWKYFIRLFYLRNSIALKRTIGDNANDIICRLNQNIDQFSSLVQQTNFILNTYQALLSGTNTNTRNINQLNFDETRKMFELSFQLLDNSMDYVKAFSVITVDSSSAKKIKVFLSRYNDNIKPFLSNFSEIGEGICTKQYDKVLDGSIALIEVALNVAAKNDSTGKAELVANAIRHLQRYGSFMLNILTAKDAKSVETALDELIPNAQYNLKNHKAFTVSLSGYPGLFVGSEMIKKYTTDNDGNINTKLPKISSWKPSLSAYLPIGIDLSFGTPSHIKNYFSTNVFFQIIDLGAVLNYRLTSDSAESINPNISFKQLLSPGVTFMRHFNNSPLVFGLGINYTPDLRTITQASTNTKQNSLRVGAFVSIDVTTIFLHTSKDIKHP